MFDLRSEKLLHRCNLVAPDCVRLLHLLSSARTAILDLVLGTILHQNGVLIMFPIAVTVHFPWNCEVISGCFFIWIFTEMVDRCEEDGLSSLLALFSSCNESVLQDGLDAVGTTPRTNRTSSCYFLHGCTEANLCLRNLVLLCSRTLSAISALLCPNELLHQIVVLLDHNDTPIL